MNDLIRELEKSAERIELEIKVLKERLKTIQGKHKPWEQIEDSSYHYFCGYIHGLRKVIELVKLYIEVFGEPKE